MLAGPYLVSEEIFVISTKILAEMFGKYITID
jgi:hypothetical protein